MLDIAESILDQLAQKLLDNEWSVAQVFDHPKLIHVIPEYDGAQNVKAISAQNFLGRMYQLGFRDITQMQVACIMRVLGKSDIENAILYEDLMQLLEIYGLPKSSDDQQQEGSDQYSDDQNQPAQELETVLENDQSAQIND